MYINSPGGIVTAGMAIYDTMQYIRPPIQTLCTGQAASMASLLLAAGEKVSVSAAQFENSGASALGVLLRPGGRHRPPRPGDPQAEEASERDLCQHTGQTVEAIENALDRDNLTADDAKTFGLVDKVIDKRAEEPAPAKTT